MLHATDPKKPVFHLGPHYDDVLLHGVCAEFIKDERRLGEARLILNTGLRDPLNEIADDYSDMLRQARKFAIPMLCANPDQVVRMGKKLVPCAGALAKIYEKMDGIVYLAGKPNHPVYALAKLAAPEGSASDPARILCIGDGLDTDILGAQQQELDAIFISQGIHQAVADVEFRSSSANTLDLDRFWTHYLTSENRQAKYWMEALKW